MTDGNVICSASGDQYNQQICSDGSGGAILSWIDERIDPDPDIYAQRINAVGVVQWTANGNVVCTASEDQNDLQICDDGSGGAIVTWYDYRSGTNYDIYAQRISSTGVIQWTTNGTAVCTATGDQYNPQLCSDGSGGAIVAWVDLRLGLRNEDIYAQRIGATGSVQWTANGRAVCTAASMQDNHRLCSDSNGGVIITWQDQRDTGKADIYAQRISNAGVIQWTANGNAICTQSGWQNTPDICTDGSSGAIITWIDPRPDYPNGIFARRINGAGAALWTTNGVAICTAPESQFTPRLCCDGNGGAIIAWYDHRSGSHYDVYASRVNASGTLGVSTPVDHVPFTIPESPKLYSPYPNPVEKGFTIPMYVPSEMSVTLTVFSLDGEAGGKLTFGRCAECRKSAQRDLLRRDESRG